MTNNVRVMVDALDDAQHWSLDPPATPVPLPSHLCHTGAPGRPRIEIEPHVLQSMLVEEPKTQVANILGCSTRTIQR